MIDPENFFILRQPTYPLDTLLRLYEQADTRPLSGLLRQQFQDPLVQQALFAASPALYERFRPWLRGEALPEEDKLLVTLHKYLVRMCSRPTPYGLFAGSSLGHFAGQSQLRADPATMLRSHTRIDMDYLLAVCRWLTDQPGIRAQARVLPNSSLYLVGGSLRYVEQQVVSGKRTYFITEADSDAYLTTVLATARAGATIGQLADQLHIVNGVEREEAAEFVEQLIEGQLLVFDLEPTVTGQNFLDRLIGRVAALTGTGGVTAELTQLRQLVRHRTADPTDRLRAYADCRQWFADRDIRAAAADIIQVDAYVDNPTLQLGERVRQTLREQIERLLVLNQPAGCPDMDAFVLRFRERYEDEEVPLSLAVDAEYGVGYGAGASFGVGYAPLIDDLRLAPADTAPATVTWDWWQRFVLDKYVASLRTTHPAGLADEIVLTDDDLACIGTQQPTTTTNLPDSFYAFGTLLAGSASALDAGDFQFNLLAVRGPSAINLLSRFAEGSDELADCIRACAAAEEAHHPDVTFAEIVHLPENRVGNILVRPTIHAYEIPYLGQSSADPAFQIPLSDLLVSVRQGRVVLRSRRLDRRIIPRLSNAHNFSDGLPLYKFLCDLQDRDAQARVGWSWGVLRGQAYLPRVRYQHIILSRATWRLDCQELTADNPLRLVAQLTAAGLPDQFLLAQGDNELLIVLHAPASLELLAQEIRRQARAGVGTDRATAGQDGGLSGYVRLVEFLATPERCPVGQKRSRFTHELVLPFRNPAARPIPGLRPAAGSTVTRRFSMGSEWFYLKVYIGEKASDALLGGILQPVVAHLFDAGVITDFFFVRYYDTDAHLRLRFRGDAGREFYPVVVRVMDEALAEMVGAGIVHRVQADTYQRELERYGLAHIDRCEALFGHDSRSTMAVLARLGDQFSETLRVGVAFRKIDRLLTDAGLSPAACLALIGTMKEQFFREFGGTTELRGQLNDKYRVYRSLVEQALTDSFPLADTLAEFEPQQAETMRELVVALADEPERLPGMLSSLIHMLVNRLFTSKQRAYELILYHCLARYYDSVRARKAKQG